MTMMWHSQLAKSTLIHRLANRFRSFSCVAPARQQQNTIAHDPLRVLFCGADQFSIYSLKALNDVRVKFPEKVASIDVVCRPDKRVGRGLKNIQEVPIKRVAIEELELPIHQIDTFTGWSPPRPDGEPINLIVAVSFGLLVPPRILNAAKYGGLNVHPSMLPDLRGSAPLHHTLLNRLQHTGVTLQTLHPKHFDQGRIVDQTPQPGLNIPSLRHATIESLLQFLGPLGAEMLERNILTGSFAKDQSEHVSISSSAAESSSLRYAGKIKPEDRNIPWQEWSADEIELRDRVLGRTWATDVRGLGTKRVTFEKWRETTNEFTALARHHHQLISLDPAVNVDTPHLFGVPLIFSGDPEKRVFFHSANATIASPGFFTVEGKPKAKAESLYQRGMDHGIKIDSAHHRPRMTAMRKETATKRPTVDTAGVGKKSGQEISWLGWTRDTFLRSGSEGTVTVSSDEVVQSLRQAFSGTSAGRTTLQTGGLPDTVSQFTFHNWRKVSGGDYHRLFQNDGELFTCASAGEDVRFGSPIFISGDDRKKRVMFWVWGDGEGRGLQIVSPEWIEMSGGGKMSGKDIYKHFMGSKGTEDGERRARLVGHKELREFHEWKGCCRREREKDGGGVEKGE